MKILSLVLCWFGTATAWAQLDEGLIARYDFSGDANDVSGNENHGIVYGATPAPDRQGYPGRALYFDGIDDYVDIGSLGAGDFDTYTISLWVRTESKPGVSVSLFGNWEDGHNMMLMGLNASDHSNSFRRGKLYFIHRDPDSTNGGNFEGGDYSNIDHLWNDMHADVFTHVTVVRDALNESQKLYVDGVLNHEITPVTQSAMTKDAAFLVGKLAIYDIYFEGVMDELRIYGRALSESEVRALAGEGCETQFEACIADNGLQFETFSASDHGLRFGADLDLEYMGFEWGYTDPIKQDAWGNWTLVDASVEVLGAEDSDNWLKARASDEGKGAKITRANGFVFQSMMLYTDDRPSFLSEVKITYRTLDDVTSQGTTIQLLPNRWVQVNASDLGTEGLVLKSMWFNGPCAVDPNGGKFGLDDFRSLE